MPRRRVAPGVRRGGPLSIRRDAAAGWPLARLWDSPPANPVHPPRRDPAACNDGTGVLGASTFQHVSCHPRPTPGGRGEIRSGSGFREPSLPARQPRGNAIPRAMKQPQFLLFNSERQGAAHRIGRPALPHQGAGPPRKPPRPARCGVGRLARVEPAPFGVENTRRVESDRDPPHQRRVGDGSAGASARRRSANRAAIS